MEDFTFPSVGARLKKWECWTPILKIPHTAKFLFFLSYEFEKRGEGGKGSSPQSVKLQARIIKLRAIVACLPCTGACNSLIVKFPFFLLPTFLGTCGQLLLVGYNTCPPCPNFSKKIHFSITFDP
jgi:hypothetical protein